MEIDVNKQDSIARVIMIGRMDFTSHLTFTEGTDPLLRDMDVKVLEMDFEGVTYIDSSGLGMLLLLKERVRSTARSITLVNCTGVVAQVFELANFNKLFTIR